MQAFSHLEEQDSLLGFWDPPAAPFSYLGPDGSMKFCSTEAAHGHTDVRTSSGGGEGMHTK